MGWIHHMGASINGGSQMDQHGWFIMEHPMKMDDFGDFGVPPWLETFTIRAMVKTWDGHHSMLSSGPLVVFECPLSDGWPYHIYHITSKMTTASIPVTFLRTLGWSKYSLWVLVDGFKYIVVHNIWDNPSHRLSYVSRWLKPPTRFTMGHRCPFPTGLLWSGQKSTASLVHPAAAFMFPQYYSLYFPSCFIFPHIYIYIYIYVYIDVYHWTISLFFHRCVVPLFSNFAFLAIYVFIIFPSIWFCAYNLHVFPHVPFTSKRCFPFQFPLLYNYFHGSLTFPYLFFL